MDDVTNGCIGLVDGGLDFAFGTMAGIWLMVEEAVGKRSAEPLVKEHEEKGDLNSLV